MYCKRADVNAGYLTTYTYCPDVDNERCIKNFDEYVNPEEQCIIDLKEGWQLDIDADCGAVDATPGLCPSEFITSEALTGTNLGRKTVLLSENTKCTIMLDATASVGRVTFSGSKELGVLHPGYQMETPITVEKGNI